MVLYRRKKEKIIIIIIKFWAINKFKIEIFYPNKRKGLFVQKLSMYGAPINALDGIRQNAKEKL